MASSQRPYSDEADLASAPHPGPPAQGKPETPRRWRNGYAWILLALVLGFWYVGFGWGNSGGWIWGHGDAGGNEAAPSASGVVILEVGNKQDYIGQSFQIQSIAVDHWSGDRAVWIGSRHSYLPMLLILPSDSTLAPPAAGDANSGTAPGSSSPGSPAAEAKAQLLDVTGKVMKAPPTAQAQQQWKLSDEDVDQLEEEGVYIQATSVQPATH